MAEDEKTNILVVDDLPENLLVYQLVLEELGQNVITARSGQEALKLLLQHDFAVILLDVNMVSMDGFETANLIRQRKKSALTPVIFLTAFADEMRTAEGYAHGAVDYIPTPVVPEILRAKVKVFIDLFRMREQAARQAGEKAMRVAAEKAANQWAFLAKVSAVMFNSLDMDAIVRNLVTLPVPHLADLCAVRLAEGKESAGWSEVAWVDGDGKFAAARSCAAGELHGRLARAMEGVLATGKRKLLDHCDPDTTTADSPPAGDFPAAFPRFALEFAMVLPLAARGRMLGAIALGMGPSGRRHSPDVITLAEDFASRAGAALDNALLMRQIQENDRRKDEFLAMLAHELRNPLGPIRNAVEILRLTGLEEQNFLRSREMIDRQVTHMARLVDDLLDATRIARGKILLRRKRCDLCGLVRQTAEDYRNIFESNRLRLDVDIPAEPLWVDGDPTRLAQVVGNLLNNAYKFTNPGGHVLVRVAPAAGGRQCAVTVRDSGIGIDASMLPRIFDVFSQADRSLDRSRGGLGLGLALVKGLVELHGGEVDAMSDGVGRGAEVTFRLSMRSNAVAMEPREALPGSSGTKSSILIIDDNRDAAESTLMLLSLAGHSVSTAYTGATGLEAARSSRPQVILCDIGLPGGMNGYDVARAIRQDPMLSSAYLIALTGYGREEDRRQANEAGFDLHLTKPVDYESLRGALARCFRGN